MSVRASKLRVGPMREIFLSLERQGWRIEITKKNHLKLFSPEGGIVVASGTPSDWRAMMQLRADLRRHGYKEVA